MRPATRLCADRVFRAFRAPALFVVGTALLAAACTPTVKVEPSDKPIVINLNVKIEQEVRVRIEDDAKKLIEKRPDLF